MSLRAGRPFVLVFQQSLEKFTARVEGPDFDISPAV